ncbi:MAG: ABC transporter permease [Endomicrobiaceae bacterium]|nr:ABC transporter permease [Endomicrobiaceae bacterium]
MSYLVDVIIKELKLIFTNKYYLFLIFLWPFIDFIFLGGIYFYGNVQNMPIAVIDKDHSKLSRTISRYFDTSYAFDVHYKLDDIEDFRYLLTRNKIFMGIYIPKNTQKNVKKSLPAEISFYIDGSNYLTANLSEIEGANVLGTINAGLKNTMMKKRGIQSKQAKDMMLPIQNDTSKMFNPSYNYGYFLTPGLWISILGQLFLIFGTLTIGKELEKKQHNSNSIFMFMFGKLFVYTIISVIYFEILFRIFFPAFQIPFDGNTSGAVILSVLFIISTILLGMLMAAVTGNRLDALKGCLLIGAPAFLLSGYTWPLEQMPTLMRNISYFIPLSSYLEGFRKIFQQNMHIQFIIPFAKILITLVILYFLLTYITLLLRNKFIVNLGTQD